MSILAEAVHKEILLQRLFLAFPAGLPGLALLLLRAVFSAALLVQAASYFDDPGLERAGLPVAIVSIAAGALLLIGLLTPIAGVVVALSGLALAWSLFPACSRPLFGSGMPLLFAVSILFAIVILGPGAYSIDACFFGRREIIIPRRSDSPRADTSR